MGIIMQALQAGLAEWIKSFFQIAAKKGLAIFVLAGATIGLSAAVVYLFRINNDLRDNFRIEIKAQIAEVRNEYRTEISDLKTRLSVCEEERVQFQIRVATLETIVKSKR